MDAIKTAQAILSYYDTTRGVGHTKAMLNGALSDEDVIIITHAQHYADKLCNEHKHARVYGVEHLSDKLCSTRNPIVFDNATIYKLLLLLLKEHEKIEERLEATKVKLSNIVSDL